MQNNRKTPPHETAVLWLVGISVAVAPLAGAAQESMLAGLGWHKNSAGTQVDGNSQLQVQDNKVSGSVLSTGGKGSALANAGMRIDLASTAQANGIGFIP